MMKKLLSLLLAVCMLIVTVPAFAAMGSVAISFNGKTIVYGVSVQTAVNNQLLNGPIESTRPAEYMTRAELVTIVNRAFGATELASLSNYSDVQIDKWYSDEMAKALAMSTILGNGTKLNPGDFTTWEEAFVVLARAFKLTGGDQSVLKTFHDGILVSFWAKDGTASLVAALAKTKYVTGSNGKLNPQAYITRDEMAQLMDALVSNYIKTPGVKTDNLTGNAMINIKGVTLKNMTITGDLIIGDGVGDGVVILDGVTVTGRIVVRSTATRVIYLNCPLSSDATLVVQATVKGILISVGTPDATLASAVGSTATIADGNAADTTNSNFFLTLFRATDSYGVVKVVKYGAGTDTAHFATDAAYANQALSNGDFFIIRVTAGDGTTVLYYKVVVVVPWHAIINQGRQY